MIKNLGLIVDVVGSWATYLEQVGGIWIPQQRSCGDVGCARVDVTFGNDFIEHHLPLGCIPGVELQFGCCSFIFVEAPRVVLLFLISTRFVTNRWVPPANVGNK